MNSNWAIAVLFFGGCDTTTLTTTACSNALPDTNKSRVEAWCTEHAIPQGEGRTGDSWLGGSSFRAVMRTPLASLTNPAVGGGGLVDLALWDDEDIIHEVTPLFQNGWLKITSTTQTFDSITHTGTIQCWPGDTCVNQGDPASISWQISSAKIWVSGPDALLVHPKGTARVTDDSIQINHTLLQHDGEITSDRGGEFVLTGASWIALNPATETLTPTPENNDYSSENSGIIAFEWPTDRSRKHRIDNTQTRNDAFESGITLIIDAPEDDVGNAVTGDDVFVRQGLTSTNSDFSIRSWPWSSNSKLAGHGAISIADLSAQDALNILWGGPGINRYTVVDLAWLDHFKTPGLAKHKPNFVWLDGVPGGFTLPDWDPWYRWLDARENVPALGPFTWAPLIDPTRPSATELERALLAGRSVATSGPNINLFVGDGKTGDEVKQDGTLQVQIRLSEDANFTHLVLVADAGMPLIQWNPRPTQRIFQADIETAVSWVIAIGWNESGDEWAATSPVWVY
jgi:hypothetical protein